MSDPVVTALVLAALAEEISGAMWTAIGAVVVGVVTVVGGGFGVLFAAYRSVVSGRIQDLTEQRDAARAEAVQQKDLRERESAEKNQLMKMVVRAGREGDSGP